MNINNRQEDLMKVFDHTWQANHNNGVKESLEKERKFINRMFNVNTDNNSNNRAPANNFTPSSQLNNLQKNMEGASKFQQQAKVNSILNKWH